jgi:hypothetical protein
MDLPRLALIATDMGVNLGSWVPEGSLRDRAFKFISRLNSEIPPRDRVFLEWLRGRGNAIVRDMVDRLLTPTYLEPEDGERNAIVLGRAPFIGRPDLRAAIEPFTNPSRLTTRVLVVRGEKPGGKSYSWGYLQHLAFSTVGATPFRMSLKNTNYTPRDLLVRALDLLRLDSSRMPPMIDDPQLARIEPLINWVKGQLPLLDRPYWLVIDDLNDESVTVETREAAYALAYCAEEARMDLWVVLLGYNRPITDSFLGSIAIDEASFPDAELVARHLERLARSSPMPLPLAQAREYATLLFSKYPVIDKENMTKLQMDVQDIGQKLRSGLQL